MPRIAFLGAGRMASAIVKGLIARGTAAPSDLICLGGMDPTAADLSARTGIAMASGPDELLSGADALVVAFKPQNLADADARLGRLAAGKLVLSIVAGKRIARLERFFTGTRNLVRCMPNTPAQIGAGITAWCAARPLSASDRALVDALLAALGESVEVDEGAMDAVTGLSGSGPGYIFEFAAALREAGIAAGLDPVTAERLTTATLLGSARLLEERRAPAERLRDEVVSPNGTTHAGLMRLNAGSFRECVRQAVLAATARSAELSAD